MISGRGFGDVVREVYKETEGRLLIVAARVLRVSRENIGGTAGASEGLRDDFMHD